MTAVFPTVAGGPAWSVSKEPQFKSRIQRSVTGRELRVLYQPVPTWQFTLTYEVLRDKWDTRQVGVVSTYDELRTIMGFYLQQQGSFSPFYFTDPTDNFVQNQLIGVGDGVTTTFQLVRTFGGFTEPILAPNVISGMVVNGVSTNYSLLPYGVIQFASPPLPGPGIFATFSYYFLCRFGADSLEFSNFLYSLWELKKVNLQSILI